MNQEDLSVKAERSQDSAEQLSPVWEDSASATQFKPGRFRAEAAQARSVCCSGHVDRRMLQPALLSQIIRVR